MHSQLTGIQQAFNLLASQCNSICLELDVMLHAELAQNLCAIFATVSRKLLHRAASIHTVASTQYLTNDGMRAARKSSPAKRCQQS